MKAFLIKSNNDKLYLSNSPFYKWTNDFCEARIEKDRDGMNQILDKVLDILCDGKVVDITIEEGNLGQQLAIYKRAFELVCEEIANNEQGKTNAFLQIQRIRNKFGIGTFQSYNDYFLERAKKELEECKDGLEN